MKYLTIDDVCDMLSISRRTLERMRKNSGDDTITVAGSEFDREKVLATIKNIGKKHFPEPDFYIGNSPRWEEEALINWLKENGKNLV